MSPSQIKAVAATGQVTSGRNAYLRNVVLTAGADAASVELREDTGGGAALLTVKAAAGATVAVQVSDAVFAGGIHATVTGTAPLATIIYG